jgi:hypothetical protein
MVLCRHLQLVFPGTTNQGPLTEGVGLVPLTSTLKRTVLF